MANATLWSLLKEHRSLRGVVDFHDTGKTFLAHDPQAYLDDLQARELCSYSARPAPLGLGASMARGLKRMVGGVSI